MEQEAARKVRLRNAAGLHARPCHAIVSLAREHDCELRVESGGVQVNGRSILELMTLCAPCEAWISFTAQGRDAAVLVERLAALVEAGFHESD
jgi:phosphotransferase system HPr (HPr) family protein